MISCKEQAGYEKRKSMEQISFSTNIEIYSSFLRNAVGVTDAVFGEGYAREHPELISMLVRAMIAESNARMIAEALQQGLVSIAHAIEQGGLVEGR